MARLSLLTSALAVWLLVVTGCSTTTDDAADSSGADLAQVDGGPSDLATAADLSDAPDGSPISDGGADDAPADAASDATETVVDAAADATSSVPDAGPVDALPDLADAAAPTDAGIWTDDCPAVPATAFGPPAKPFGLPVLGNSCAKPGWATPPGTAKLQWTDVTATLGLGKLTQVDPCLLWEDFTADGVPDVLVVEPPQTPTGKRTLRVFGLDAGGGPMSTVTPLPASFRVSDCAALDYDDDGLMDVVMSGLTGVRLLRNGGGAFEDVTAKLLPFSTQNVMAWSVGVLDFDRDGDLDLYVARTGQLPLQPGNFSCIYADQPYYQCCFDTAEVDAKCLAQVSDKMQTWTCCPPNELGEPNRLLRNDGGIFQDVTVQSGTGDGGASLTSTVHDVDRDGWPDLFVGNDFGPMTWYRNLGDGTFAKHSTAVGMRPYGHVMGAALADFDGDGLEDLVHSDFGPTSYYRGKKGGGFQFAPEGTGVWDLTKDAVSWVQLAADFDNDGWMDLYTGLSLVAHPGQLPDAVETLKKTALLPEAYSVVQRNLGGGKLQASALPWPKSDQPLVDAVVAASTDYDGDGDLDLVQTTPPGWVRVLRNDTPKVGHWLRIELAHQAGHTPGGAGALVQVFAGGHVQERQAQLTPGFGAHGQYRTHFGLGTVQQVDAVRVWWPSGKVSVLGKTAADQVVVVAEAQAIALPPPVGSDAGPSDADATTDVSDGGDALIGGPPSVSGIEPTPLTNLPLAGLTEITDQFEFADYAKGFKHAQCAAGADLDGDGSDDLLVIENTGKDKWAVHAILNKSKGMVHKKTPLNPAFVVPSLGCSLADLNADAKPDLLIGSGDAGLAMLLNLGEAEFQELTDKYLPPVQDYAAWTAAVGDFDGDQDVEILVGAGALAAECNGVSCGYLPKDFACVYSKPPKPGAIMQDRMLARATPLDKYGDVTSAWGLPEGGEATTVAAVDLDQDGWLDALVGTDFGDHYFLRNVKGKLTKHAGDVGLKPYGHLMGWGIGDFDLDGLLDVAAADAGPMLLYVQKPKPANLPFLFEDQAEAWGLASPTHDLSAWDPLVHDFDQDGLEDIYLGTAGVAPNGQLGPLGECQMPAKPVGQRDVFFRNDGGKFSGHLAPKPVSQKLGFAHVAQTALDVDGDGDLDVLQVRRDGDVHVYRNDMAKPKTAVSLKLKSTSANTAAIGARVVATFGGKAHVRQLVGNTGFGGAGVWKIHYGLGAAAQIDELVVTWPNGKKTTKVAVAAGSKLELTEP